MNRAEKMIRQMIEELSIEHIAPQRLEIQRTIKWMYWNNSLSKRKSDKLNSLLEYKYTNILDEAFKKVSDDMERSYQEIMNRH